MVFNFIITMIETAMENTHTSPNIATKTSTQRGSYKEPFPESRWCCLGITATSLAVIVGILGLFPTLEHIANIL